MLPPEEIALAIAALGRHSGGKRPSGPVSDDDDHGVDAILRLLRDEYAIDFSHYKASTVTRRIERRLALNRSLDLDIYVEQLRSDPRELNSLYEDLLIGVTRFFRDDEAFEVLEHRIIPEIVERDGDSGNDQIRVWVPGAPPARRRTRSRCCCTSSSPPGAGPSRSRFLRPTCTRPRSRWPAPALYSEEQRGGHRRGARLRQFFTLKPNGYQIAQTIRESIVFAPHNLIRDCAVHEARSDHLPQSADLFPAARAEDGADAVPLRAEDRAAFCSWGRARARAACSTSSTPSTNTPRSIGSGATSGCRAI